MHVEGLPIRLAPMQTVELRVLGNCFLADDASAVPIDLLLASAPGRIPFTVACGQAAESSSSQGD